MSALSDYLEAALLNHVFRNTGLTSPTTVYLAIFSSSASASQLEAGTLTNEITGYTGNRPAIAFGAPSGGIIASSGNIDFVSMPAVTTTYIAIMDSATKGAGNILMYVYTNSIATLAGRTLRYPAGSISLQLS